ncbi:hypothetical protein Ahy_B08g091713 [Arachis hypogaea]|uniref:Putative plant transposon protein domain-containing protein n=1 Tax=Arachis hypogaea TaxID=3818 RepID=A0A444Y2I4_ARAHY|nr:hypothetical protein Ahy_B08g091713 [Arachis hypogaea]
MNTHHHPTPLVPPSDATAGDRRRRRPPLSPSLLLFLLLLSSTFLPLSFLYRLHTASAPALAALPCSGEQHLAAADPYAAASLSTSPSPPFILFSLLQHSCKWKFILFDAFVKEFYANFLKRNAQTIFLRGVTLDTSDTTIEALLDIPHIPSACDAYTQVMKDMSLGKISLDVVLEKIGQPEARWEYSKGDNVVPLSIACTNLNPKARIWQQIIADYILPSTHATHIRVRVTVLLWAILEGKRISVLPLIRESMMKRRLTDRTSVYISKQPFLPYSDYEGPPQKKRKTTEPPTSAAVEPSAPLAAPPTAKEPRVEEQAAGPEPIVEMAVETANPTVE